MKVYEVPVIDHSKRRLVEVVATSRLEAVAITQTIYPGSRVTYPGPQVVPNA